MKRIALSVLLLFATLSTFTGTVQGRSVSTSYKQIGAPGLPRIYDAPVHDTRNIMFLFWMTSSLGPIIPAGS